MNYRTFLHSIVILIAIGLMAAIWHQPRFIQPGDVNFKTVLSPPPANDSPDATADIAQVLQLQQTRTPADIHRANSEADLSPFVDSQILGSWFNPENLPQTAALLRQAMADDATIVNQAKLFYARPRPFIADPHVKPSAPTENTFSYPSGHATHSMLIALIVSEIFPDHRDAFLTLAHQIGSDRALAGVHYPTDVKAGQALAAAIFNSMQKNPEFQHQLQSAKIECAIRPHNDAFYVASAE